MAGYANEKLDEYVLDIKTPEWSLPLLAEARFKGAKGGRSSGKSHERAEALVEALVMNQDLSAVCIREVQKSLKFSAKKLIEQKIRKFKVEHLFRITNTEISCVEGSGVIIFQGMQDHTADSIKSLEGFDIAWVEEAQNLSSRSLELLIPTIRAAGSELWFTWNPENEDDPVESLFREAANDSDFICVHVNFTENPFCTQESIKDARRHYKVNPESYDHVWLGGFNTRSKSQVFANKWRVEEFDIGKDWQPMYGADWGFSVDPTTAIECYVAGDILYIRRESYKVGLELDQIAEKFMQDVPSIEKHVIRADNARPETISYLKRKGLPMVEGVKKWGGSVEDGVEYMKAFSAVVIHPDCPRSAEEFKFYSYKVNKQTGDVMPEILDKWNHCIDAIRYALQPLIKQSGFVFDC